MNTQLEALFTSNTASLARATFNAYEHFVTQHDIAAEKAGTPHFFQETRAMHFLENPLDVFNLIDAFNVPRIVREIISDDNNHHGHASAYFAFETHHPEPLSELAPLVFIAPAAMSMLRDAQYKISYRLVGLIEQRFKNGPLSYEDVELAECVREMKETIGTAALSAQTLSKRARKRREKRAQQADTLAVIDEVARRL